MLRDFGSSGCGSERTNLGTLVTRRIEQQQHTNQSKKLTYLNRMLVKTTDYLDHFARFKRKENVEAVERLLSAHKELAKFERAQLGLFFLSQLPMKQEIGSNKKFQTGSLCCDSAEEAKTLIPSLTDKITDDDLQELLDEITKLMGYGN